MPEKPPMIRDRYREYALLGTLLVLSSFLIFNNLGKSPVHDWDEALYAENALEMRRSGDLIVTTYGGVPDVYSGKFPLGIWLTTLSFCLFGVNEFALRFWSALFGVLTVLLVYFFGKSISGKMAGLLSALLLLGNPGFVGVPRPSAWPHAARSGDLDILLTFFAIAVLYSFYLTQARNDKRYWILTWLGLGLAVMTKSAQGLFPLVVILLCLTYVRRLKEIFCRESLAGLAVFFIVVFPWCFLRALRGADFFSKLFSYHIVRRMVAPIEGHAGDMFYYFRHLENDLGIFLCVAFAAGFAAVLAQAVAKRDKGSVVLAAWIASYLAAITVIQTKLFWYLIPIYPAISLAIGKSLGDLVLRSRLKKGLVVLGLLLVIFPLASSIRLSGIVEDDAGFQALNKLKPELRQAGEIYVSRTRDPSPYANDLKSPSLFFYLNSWGVPAVRYARRRAEIPEGRVLIIRNPPASLADEGFALIKNEGDLFLFRKI